MRCASGLSLFAPQIIGKKYRCKNCRRATARSREPSSFSSAAHGKTQPHIGRVTNHKLSNKWSVVRLDEACDVILGQSPPGESYNDQGNGLPFFQGKAEFGDLYPTPAKW